MKRLIFSILLLMTALSVSAERRISIFSQHISDVAKQQKISFREAAQKVYDLGYRGVDVYYNGNPDEQQVLDEVGFKHASAIAEINFATGEHADEVKRSIDFMIAQGYDKVLLVPGLLPEDATQELIDEVNYRTEAYAHACRVAGFEVMIEDYDNPRSPCYNMASLDKLFAQAPSLNHVFDTGNYLFAGDDVMEAMHHFLDRIHHVHLKDRKALKDYSSPAVGTGIVPVKEVIVGLLTQGYEGWFTVEHFGAPDQYAYAKTSIQTVNAMVKPGEWNTYDIIYTAPVFKADGTYLYRPYVTVLHNGIVVQNHTEILGTTEWIGFPQVIPHGDGPIRLQSHGDPSEPISFRNIWIRPMK